MRRFVIFVLVLTLLLSTAINAAAYTTGICSYDFPLNETVSLMNGTANSKILNLQDSSFAKYGFTIPFDAVSMDIVYNAKVESSLNVIVDGLSHCIEIKQGENTENIKFKSLVQYGDHNFELIATKAVKITKITLNKVDIAMSTRLSVRPSADLSAEEIATEDSVILCESSNIIKVNNARRYIDYNSPKILPILSDNRVYIPLHTFARAFGGYYEEDAEKGYFFLRSMDGGIEFCYKDGILRKKADLASSDVSETVYLQKDGVTWIALRYFAEEFGESVGYREGIIIIDHKYTVRDILNNDELFAKIKKSFVADEVVEDSKIYHVAQTQNASDSNDGSINNPFKTIEKACDLAQAGDTVIVHEGTYRECVIPQNDGTSSNPLTIKAADGENVTLSANEPVEVFATYGDGGALISTIDKNLGKGKNMIFYNGEALAEARYPNYSDAPMYPDSEHYKNLKLSPLWPTQGNIKVQPGKDTGYITRATAEATSDTLLNEEDDYWKGGVLVSAHGYNWSWCTAEIKNSSKGKLNLFNTSKIFYYGNEEPNDCGYITCTKNAMDIPGEWAIENHYLYIIPPKGETADTLKLEVKQRQLVADLSNRKNVIMKGFNTIGGSIKMDNSEMCVLDNMDMKYINHFTMFQDIKDGYIDSCDQTKPGEPQRGELGIYISGRDNAVINGKMNYAAGAALYVTGLYTYIENNYINECGYMGIYPAGITFCAESWKGVTHPRGGHTVVSNTITKTGRGSISFNTYEQWELKDKSHTPYIASEVAYNDLSDAMLNTKDGGMLYSYMCCLGNDRVKSRYHHNIVSNPAGADSELIMGIYADNCTEMLEIFNNVGFYTDPTYHFNHDKSVYVQYDAYVQEWGNKTLNYFEKGKEGLAVENYPNYQVFNSGCTDLYADKNVNYELFDMPSTGSVFYAKNCEISEGAYVNDGRVYFSGANQWIKFEKVKLPREGRIKINYKGKLWEKDNPSDLVEFVIGDDINTGTVVSRTGAGRIKPDGVKWYRYFPISTDTPDEPVTLYLRVKEFASLAVESIEFEELSHGEEYSAKVYGGYYADCVPAKPEDPTSAADNSQYTDTDNYVVDRTWSGTVVHYENVKLDDDSKKFVFNSAGQEPWRGNIEVRLNSLDSEPILTSLAGGQSFYDYQTKTVNLRETVKAGTYDVYITFIDEEKSCNFAWFGFLNDRYVQTSEFGDIDLVSDKKYGGEVDKALSGEGLIVGSAYNVSGSEESALLNIENESMVCYKSIQINDDAKKLKLCLSSNAGSKRGAVSVYIGSPDSEPVAAKELSGTSTDVLMYTTLNLNQTLAKGNYDVYLKFDGGEEFSGKLYWLGFVK